MLPIGVSHSAMTAYPEWIFYPNSVRPPDWVASYTAAAADAEPLVSSLKNDGLTSDEVLKRLRPRLADLGFNGDLTILLEADPALVHVVVGRPTDCLRGACSQGGARPTFTPRPLQRRTIHVFGPSANV